MSASTISRPSHKLRLRPRCREQDHGPLAVREVRVAREIVAWRGRVAGADAVDVAGGFDPAGLQQVFDHVVAGFVDVGVDAMGREVPGLPGEADADVAADLSDPHAPRLESQRREPESQVEPLVDRTPAPLQGDVLTATE